MHRHHDLFAIHHQRLVLAFLRGESPDRSPTLLTDSRLRGQLWNPPAGFGAPVGYIPLNGTTKKISVTGVPCALSVVKSVGDHGWPPSGGTSSLQSAASSGL